MTQCERKYFVSQQFLEKHFLIQNLSFLTTAYSFRIDFFYIQTY